MDISNDNTSDAVNLSRATSRTISLTSDSTTRDLDSKLSLATFKQYDWSQLWDIFLARFLIGFAIIVYRSNFALMLDIRFDVSAKTIGYITSYTAVVGTISGLLVGNVSAWYKDDTRLLLHTSILQFLSILTLSVAPSLWILVLCLAPLSLANAIARVAMANVTIQRGPGKDTGGLLGLGAGVLSVARMLSPLVAGVAQEFHVSGSSLVGAVFAGLGVCVIAHAARVSTIYIDKKTQ